MASLVACDGFEPPAQACWVPDTPTKSNAVVAQLEKDGVKVKVSPEKGICVPSDKAAALTAAREAIAPLRFELLLRPRDLCEKVAMLDWLKQNRLAFEEAESVDAEGKGAEALIRVIVPSRADAERYQKLLAALPKDTQCKK